MAQTRSSIRELRGEDASYASNTLGAKDVFIERIKYREEIFPPGLVPNFRDLWGEDTYYGMLNAQANAVSLNDTHLKQLYYSTENTVFAVNFVADAWRDFCEKMRELASNNIIHRDSPWAAPSAFKGWEGLDNLYNDYLTEQVYPSFSQIFLGQAAQDQKIIDFGSYLGVFSDYVERVHGGKFPITRSGFIEGSLCPPSISGLTIELAQQEYDNDLAKSTEFKDQNFEIAAQIASQYGFSIDRNVPWRLVADLNNPSMREYMYGLPIEDIVVDNKNDINCDDPILRDPATVPEAFSYSQVPELEFVKRRMNTYLTDAEVPTLAAGYRAFRQLKLTTNMKTIYNTLFTQYYDETWKEDMFLLRVYLYAMYKSYVTDNPTVTTYTKTPSCARGTTTITTRQVPPAEIITQTNELYGHLWDLKSFYVLRSMERQDTASPQLKTQNIQKIYATYRQINASDSERYLSALKYCQSKFIGPVREPGLTYRTVSDIIENK